MSRIFVCGLCPLPFEDTRQSYGPGIRTWQMAHSLAQAGHEVHLVAMRIDGTYEDAQGIPDRELRAGVEIERLTAAEFFDRELIADRLARAAPDAVVGATIYGSYVLAEQRPRVPFWADQFGHVMAEAQAKAHLEGANWPLAHFWNLLAPVMRSADRVSVVSARQRWAAVGELGVVGRLNAETCGYDFTSLMPCALLPPAEEPETQTILRGNEVPEDAFVSLWSGGYNVWSDVDTLFRAHEIAMAEDESLHFVSTGGGIAGHDESTYASFEASIAASRFRDRFHLQGWVRRSLVPSYQAEADLGVLCEIPMYEGQLGSKNRVVQWLGGGLPVLYNAVGDLGDLLEHRRLGLTFPVGSAERMAEQLLWAAANREELAAMARRAEDYACEELSFEATTVELLEWAEAPSFAPDVEIRASIRAPGDYSTPRPPAQEPAPATTTSTKPRPAVGTNGSLSRRPGANGSGKHGASGAAKSNGASGLGPAALGAAPASGFGRALRRLFSLS